MVAIPSGRGIRSGSKRPDWYRTVRPVAIPSGRGIRSGSTIGVDSLKVIVMSQSPLVGAFVPAQHKLLTNGHK